MPQSTPHYLLGLLRLTVDTLSQRLLLSLDTITRHYLSPSPPLSLSPTHLSSQTALITGSNTGIGFETARQLLSLGASIILACRNLPKAETAAHSLRQQYPASNIHLLHCDLADLNSVRRCATQFHHWDRHNNNANGLNILILNAGVMAVPHTTPESHFLVNHVAHALLTLLLLPPLATAAGRVVIVSSLTCVISDLRLDDLHFQHRPYNWMTAYANSKLSMLLFMRHLIRHLPSHTRVTINAANPGESTSDVARYLGPVWMWLHQRVGRFFLLTPAEAARTSVYVAAASELHGVSGAMFERTCKQMSLPDRLFPEVDVQRMWDATLKSAHVTPDDLRGLPEAAKNPR